MNHCDWQWQACCAVCHNTLAVSIGLCRDGCHDAPGGSYSTLKLGYSGLFCRKTQKHILLGNMPTQHAGLCPKLPCSIVVALFENRKKKKKIRVLDVENAPAVTNLLLFIYLLTYSTLRDHKSRLIPEITTEEKVHRQQGIHLISRSSYSACTTAHTLFLTDTELSHGYHSCQQSIFVSINSQFSYFPGGFL